VRVLIVGAERLGGVLARDLVAAGHEIRILDEHAERLSRLPAELEGRTVHGSPLDRPTLADAVAGCDAVATTSADDAMNAVVALAARGELGAPLAVAVIGNASRAETLTGLGVHVLCPTIRAAHELHMTLVRSGVESELMLGDEVGVYRAELPAHLTGRTLAELERPGELIPLAVERSGRTVLAVPGLALEPGDVLYVAASTREHVRDLVRA